MSMKKSMATACVAAMAGVVMALSGCSASSSSDNGASHVPEVVKGAQVTLSTGESVGDNTAVQVLHPATAESTDVETTPSIMPNMFETAQCPYPTAQYTFGETGSWPEVTMQAAKNGDERGYYIHVEQVPVALMMRVNEMVPAGNGIDSEHLVEAWKVFNMPFGHNGQEDFFVAESDLGEYPDSAVSYTLACGTFNE